MNHRMLLATAGLLLATSAAAGTRQNATTIMPDDPQMRKANEAWGYSDAIVTGDTVYVSGVVVSLRRGETDFQAAYTRAFDHVATILKRANVSWDDVVDITSYHTDLTTQMPAIVAVKNRYVKAPFPAWTAIEVSRLIPDRGITEIKIVARLAN